MLQTNQGLPLKRTFQKRKILLHPETLRGILRFTYGGTLWPMYRLQNSPQPELGLKMLASLSGVYEELLHNSNFQRRTQSENSHSKAFSTFYEKVKKEIRSIKSLLKKNSKGTI